MKSIYIILLINALFLCGCNSTASTERKDNSVALSEQQKNFSLNDNHNDMKQEYSFSGMTILLEQEKVSGQDYLCKSILTVIKDQAIIDSISFKSEPVGGYYGICFTDSLTNHFIFTKHGDYDGRTLIINGSGQIINLIGGNVFLDETNNIVVSIYDSDGTGVSMYNLNNDKLLFEMKDLPLIPISIHKMENRYFIKGISSTGISGEVWEIETELDRIMQMDLTDSEINKKNILREYQIKDAICNCQ